MFRKRYWSIWNWSVCIGDLLLFESEIDFFNNSTIINLTHRGKALYAKKCADTMLGQSIHKLSKRALVIVVLNNCLKPSSPTLFSCPQLHGCTGEFSLMNLRLLYFTHMIISCICWTWIMNRLFRFHDFGKTFDYAFYLICFFQEILLRWFRLQSISAVENVTFSAAIICRLPRRSVHFQRDSLL